ncbi:hypothetical protein RGQ29_004871 [Quercus rubra]|uniref:RRM domain-containing protein n=1 Tax=Quercus rubra TaxID=3512 RepID=A0AAN7I6P6_QUERU|nr:hypothetical protein RGQ29_004871 [Quercus rubra]
MAFLAIRPGTGTEKKEEVADPERDQRTIFAYQICLKANERYVYEFFSKAGKVRDRDVRLIMDRNSRRSKGVGYIEFYDAMSVPMAIVLSGLPLLGQPVMPCDLGPAPSVCIRLLLLFGFLISFGQVKLVQLPVDETGHCNGYGFVQFAHLEDARNALSLNQQLEIAGRLIKVSALTDQTGMQDVGANSGDFDDDEGGGLSLNARSRALLMFLFLRCWFRWLNSTGLTLPTVPILGAAPAVSPITPLVPALAGLGGSGLQVPIATLPTVDTIGVPRECLLLKDMFDPNDE